jgi:ParB/RepB/Spo0J family partition protein
MKVEPIPMELIDPPADAHRLTMDEQRLYELADSIRDVGLLQPIILTQKEGRYEIVAGHRRFVAHKVLNRDTIEAIVQQGEWTLQSEASRFAENLQRADLTPIEEAVAILRLSEATGATSKDIARKVNMSEHWVESRLALLEAPDDLQQHVHGGTLKMTSALILARCTDEGHRKYLTAYALRSGASAAVLREWVSAWELSVKEGELTPPVPAMDQGNSGPVTIQMPCFICAEPHDHTALIILRGCRPCVNALKFPKT